MPARYMITDRRTAGGVGPLLSAIDRRLAEGIDFIQIREKDLEARELFHLATAIVARVRGTTKVLVNSRFDVALAAGAHGVHLPGGAPSPAAFRPIIPLGFLIGTSCHSVEEVRACQADYCLFGPVLSTLSKTDTRPPVGFPGLREAVAASSVPVFALGGLQAHHEAEVSQTGAAGLAGITLFLR